MCKRSRPATTKKALLVAIVVIIAALLAFQFQVAVQINNDTKDDGVDTLSQSPPPGALAARLKQNNATTTGLDVAAKKRQSYDPALHPVFSSKPPNTRRPLRVAIVTIYPLQGEALHFLYDGVVQSQHLELVGVVSLYGGDIRNVTTAMEGVVVPVPRTNASSEHVDLWLVDGQRVAKLTNRTIWKDILVPGSSNHSVLMVDYSDRFQFQRRHYVKLGVWKIMMQQQQQQSTRRNVRLAVRSIVEGRVYNMGRNAIHSAGHLAKNPFQILHFPYAVRSDTVHAMLQELQSLYPSEDSLWKSRPRLHAADDHQTLERIQQLLTHVTRNVHVYHPWQVTAKTGQSELRNSVSRLVRSWDGVQWNGTTALGLQPSAAAAEYAIHHNQSRTTLLNTSIEEAGERMHQGRNSVDPRYIRALLDAKIIIVAQRHSWEDHYRLFEAMACGPLVISDRMLAPPKGLVHGETIVFFDNLEQLQALVEYYLRHDDERIQIAKAGWMLAMTRHRSWHRLETTLFGNTTNANL